MRQTVNEKFCLAQPASPLTSQASIAMFGCSFLDDILWREQRSS